MKRDYHCAKGEKRNAGAYNRRFALQPNALRSVGESGAARSYGLFSSVEYARFSIFTCSIASHNARLSRMLRGNW